MSKKCYKDSEEIPLVKGSWGRTWKMRKYKQWIK